MREMLTKVVVGFAVGFAVSLVILLVLWAVFEVLTWATNLGPDTPGRETY